MINDRDTRFAPFAAKMRREGLPSIVIDNFRYYYDLLVSGDVGMIPEESIVPADAVTDIADVASYAAAGEQAIARAVIIKLNGGLGTSMGLERAKSLLVAHAGLSFLDIIARQTLAYSERYTARIPLVLMNSFSTDADTQAVLARYPQLQGDIPQVFLQSKVPKVLQGSLAPAEYPADPDLEWCPPGHGEIYSALATSGLLDTLLARGYEYAFVSNADNLGATLDIRVLGYVAQERVPFLMEVTDRTEADKKGGHIAQRPNGQLILREIAQCPDTDLPAFQDIRRHRYFNTNNIWINLVFLKQLLTEQDNVIKLPMIRNVKTLDPRDSSTPAVVQLETAMGAAIGVFAGAAALRVNRDRFLPVKTCADLLGLRSDIYQLDDLGRLRMNPARQLGPITASLDPHYYKLHADFEERFPHGPPSLIGCTSFAVTGDIVFGSDVTITGAVQFANRTNHQIHVDGTHLVTGLYEYPVRTA